MKGARMTPQTLWKDNTSSLANKIKIKNNNKETSDEAVRLPYAKFKTHISSIRFEKKNTHADSLHARPRKIFPKYRVHQERQRGKTPSNPNLGPAFRGVPFRVSRERAALRAKLKLILQRRDKKSFDFILKLSESLVGIAFQTKHFLAGTLDYLKDAPGYAIVYRKPNLRATRLLAFQILNCPNDSLRTLERALCSGI